MDGRPLATRAAADASPLTLDALSGLLERVEDGVVVLDRDWRYRYVNRAAALFFGRTPSDLIGRHIWTEFPEGIGQPFHLAYERAMETQQQASFEDYYAPWDRWFENRLYPARDGLAIFFSEITARKKSELHLRDTIDRLNLVLEGTQTGLWDWDLGTNKVRYSREWKSQIGYREDEIGDDFEEWRCRVHPDDLGDAVGHVQASLHAGSADFENEFRFRHRDGSYLWVLARAHIVRDDHGAPVRMVGYHIDNTQRKAYRLLLEGQNRVLALAAAGAPPGRVLEEFASVVESVMPDAVASVLLLDEDGRHVRHSAAPSLPPAFVAAIDGQPIGPRAGSCGTAMYRREAVIVTDIASDPLWTDYRGAAEAAGLRACWSQPILDDQRTVLGSFAVYFRAPRRPTAAEERIIASASSVAAVVISSARKTESLAASERQLRQVISEAPLAIAMFDREMRYLVHSERWLADYGLENASLAGRSHYDVFPEIDERWKSVHRRAIGGEALSADSDPFVRADGRVQWVRWDTRPWRDASGRIGGIIIASEDVTVRLEAARQQEAANRQLRLLAAGLERAREAERTRIARELHDELGQVLTGIKMDLAWVRGRLPDGELQGRVQALMALVDDAVRAGRRIASELRPGVLDDLGLGAALRWQGREFERRSGIAVSLVIDEDLTVDAGRSTAIFRVVQEALTNVARHAGASAVHLALRQESGDLLVEVEDDGVGIGTDALRGLHSLGLLGMRERVATWGGTLEIAPGRTGRGTVLRARLPLTATQEGGA